MKKIKDYKIMLFDLDNTLLNFSKAERYALIKLASEFNLSLKEEEIQAYVNINKKYWQLSDEGKLPRNEILKLRFIEFFKLFNLDVDGAYCDETYRNNLSSVTYLVDGCEEVLEELSKNHDIYVVSNGVKKTQYKRLSRVDITKYFKKIFLSEEVGYSKPDIRFFDYVFKNIDNFDKDECIIIGDNLYTDIYGGHQAGIATAFYNFENVKNLKNDNCNYEILSLFDILK